MENQDKVLALIGYTRKNGNTQALLEDYLKEFAQDKEVDLVDLNALDFKGCIHCNGCLKEPFCRLRDDFSPIYQKIEEANHLVFASPVYFNGDLAFEKGHRPDAGLLFQPQRLAGEKVGLSFADSRGQTLPRPVYCQLSRGANHP